MNLNILRILTITFALIAFPAWSLAQDGGGDAGGGTGGNTGTDFGGGTTGGGGGIQNAGEDFDITDNLNIQSEIPEFEDLRNQGFVGATTDRITEQGFVGGLSNFVGGSSEGSFGGTLNSSVGGGTGGFGGGRGGGNLGFGGAGAQNGFEIIRPKVLRTRLRVSFDAPQVPEDFISARFQNRLVDLPAIRGNPNVQVSIQGRTATISGVAQNRQEARLIERQLRLEPGVYRIVNNLQYQSR